jgi:hypothetical protein
MAIAIPLPIAKGGTGQAAAGIDAFAAGVLSSADGAASVAIGVINAANGLDSTAIGVGNISSQEGGSAIGRSNLAIGEYSSASGFQNTAFASSSSAFGNENYGGGTRSSAFGYDNTVATTGTNSSAFGYGTNVSGANSSAFGYYPKTTVSNTFEAGYWPNTSTRGGGLRADSSGMAALTTASGAAPLGDGGATAGSEAVGALPRGMVALRVASGELFADYNVSGSVASNLLARKGSTELGYSGTGTGGTVTQLTSKSTSVTLDKLCGQITMSNAALAQSTTVSFTLNNTNIHSTDVIIVNIQSGATANAYTAFVEAVNTGSCRIHLRNSSSSSLSEAVVLNFAVIKAVSA